MSCEPESAIALDSSAESDLQRIRLAMPELLRQYERVLFDAAVASPLLYLGDGSKVVAVRQDTWGTPADWFFIGDMHGDFFALHTLLRHAEITSPNCRIVFLGDMVDRGDCSLECVFLLLDWAARHPSRVIWIAGNHDIALKYNEQTRCFSASVDPAEFLSEINGMNALSGFQRELGRFFIRLADCLPRAVLFPDGLLATHGGFPLVDLHGEGSAAETLDAFIAWLNSPQCLKDFTWTRIHRAQRRQPDRYSSDPSYGVKDFEAFCTLKPDWLPVKRMITGHMHPADGYEVHATYKLYPALTIVGFGFEDSLPVPECYGSYKPTLHLARYVESELPTVLHVPVDHDELRMLYPSLIGSSPATREATASSGVAPVLMATA